MIRGFVAGVVWGGVVAGLVLAVISQVAPGPVPMGVVTTGADAPQPVAAQGDTAPQGEVVPVAPPVLPGAPEVGPADDPAVGAVVGAAAETAAGPAPAAPPPSDATGAADAPTRESAAPDAAATGPDVVAATQPPVAPPEIDRAVRPEIPALTPPALVAPATSAVPDGLQAPDVGAPASPSVETDLPPPEPQDPLLLPAPQPVENPPPARIGVEQAPVPDAPPLPRATLPEPDAAPEVPVARPVDVPKDDAAPADAGESDAAQPDPAPSEVARVSPQPPVLQPVRPIIAEDAPRALAPDPQLPPVEGVRVGQLPKIGGVSVPPPEAAAEPAAFADPDAPPLQQFARPFENPQSKPLFSILLRDTGAPDLDRAALAQISFPVTFVIDPLAPGAAEAAQIYREGGQEVLMLASGIPAGATPGDLEQTFQSLSGTVPEAVGVMDQPDGGFQGNRPLAAQVVPILSAQGRGLVTFDVGLNAADQEARRASLPSAMIFRRLDAEGEDVPVIRRYLDRAAFKAAQEGRVVVLGDTRPETIAALLEWAVEGRAASVTLAPVTAVMTGQ